MVIMGSPGFQLLSHDGTKAFNAGNDFIIRLMKVELDRWIPTFYEHQFVVIKWKLHLALMMV
jgi:hypothetical protein